MNINRVGCLGVFFGIVLCVSVLLNFLLVTRGCKRMAQSNRPERLKETVVESGTDATRIVLIPLHGLISSNMLRRGAPSMVDQIKAQLRQAATDPAVKAIVLDVDSPGGEVTASDILYKAVRQVGKPVVVSMSSLAASGAYYISCGGTYLMADETTLTGSIGVIIESFEYKDLLGKLGIVPRTFKSGAFKDMLSGTRDMTDAEKQYVQDIIIEFYGKFLGIVATQRHLPEEQLRSSGLADGRVITGKDALAAKLIDGIGEVEDAYKKARELGKAPGAAVVRYETPFRFWRLLRAFGLGTDSPGFFDHGKVEINLMKSGEPQLEPGKAYFLPGNCLP